MSQGTVDAPTASLPKVNSANHSITTFTTEELDSKQRCSKSCENCLEGCEKCTNLNEHRSNPQSMCESSESDEGPSWKIPKKSSSFSPSFSPIGSVTSSVESTLYSDDSTESSEQPSEGFSLRVGNDGSPSLSPEILTANFIYPTTPRSSALHSRGESSTPETSRDACSSSKADGDPPIPVLNVIDGVEFVSCDVVQGILEGKYQENLAEFNLIDCRFSYEYQGGHISTAVNLCEWADLLAFYEQCQDAKSGTTRGHRVVILHCEMSSERAPWLWRALRRHDRLVHAHCYPKLLLPWLYVMQGGYREFFSTHPSACDPQSYTPMRHERYRTMLLELQTTSPTWSSPRNKKRRPQDLRGSASASSSSSSSAPSLSPSQSPISRVKVKRSLFS